MTGPYRDLPSHGIAFDTWAGIVNPAYDEDGFCYIPEHASIGMHAGPMFGALGILMALLERKSNPEAAGQVVSVSLFESMFRILDFLPIEYDQLGEVRQRAGNRNPYAAPGNCYRTRDGHWCTVAASTQALSR